MRGASRFCRKVCRTDIRPTSVPGALSAMPFGVCTESLAGIGDLRAFGSCHMALNCGARDSIAD